MAGMSSDCGGGKGIAGARDVGKQGPKPRSDNLRCSYASAADDGAASGRQREAAMLFSVAEGHLRDEDPEEALASAQGAVKIFRELQNGIGVADSLRLVLHATRELASAARADGDAEESERLLEDVDEAMGREHVHFIELRDKRGQAAMLLAAAEAKNSLGGTVRRREALEGLFEAEELLEEVPDKKLQGLVALEKCAVLAKKHNYKESQQAAREAVVLFREIRDPENEAFALYALGAGEINNGHLEEGMHSKMKALKLWRGTGDRKFQGNTLNSLAEWYITERDDHRAGLAAAEEALVLFKELGDPAGEAIARGWVLESHIRSGKVKLACEMAGEGLDVAREHGDKKDNFWALQHAANAYLAAKDFEQALMAAEDAVTLCKNMVDRRWVCSALSLVADVHQGTGQWEKAKQAMLESVDLSKDLRGFEDEAFSHMQALARILVQKDEYSTSLKVMEQARKLGQKKGEVYLEALAMLGMIGVHAMLGDIDRASSAAELARELFREEGYPRGEARVMKILSEVHWTAGDYVSATRAAQEGVAIVAKFGDNRYQAMMKHVLATVHLSNDHPSEAAKAAMEGLKLARGEDDKSTTIKMIFMVLESNNTVLQEAVRDDKRTRTFKSGCEKMMRLAKEAVGLSLKIGDKGTEALANYWVAHMHIMLGRPQEAMQAASAAIALGKEAGSKPLEVRSLMLVAHAHAGLGGQEEAVAVLRNAESVAAESGDAEDLAQVRALLEEIAGSRGSGSQAAPREAAAEVAPHSSAAQEIVYRAPDPTMVKQHILHMVKNMTGNADGVDGDTALMDSGIDSLSSVELRAQLQSEFRLNLPSTVMFNYPTISQLTQLMVEECTSKKLQWGR